MKNQLKTAALLALLTVILLLIGSLFGRTGLIVAAVFAIGLNFISYFFSDKIVLKMYRAQQVTKAARPDLYRMVESIARKASIPTPRIYVIPDQSPNAFATGRNPKHAVVAYTEGILKLLNENELEGVTAHEIAHIKNRDILVSTIAAMLAGIISYLAWSLQWFAFLGGGDDDSGGIIGMIAAAILAPLIAALIQMAISRSREYLADETGAKITRKPRHLADALKKLHSGIMHNPLDKANEGTSFLFIANPFGRRGRKMMQWFSTHPPMEERVARLERMRY